MTLHHRYMLKTRLLQPGLSRLLGVETFNLKLADKMIIIGEAVRTDPGTAPPHAMAKLVILACGNIMMTLMITHFSAVTIERVSADARGRALGLINSSISLGQLLIPFVSEPLRVGLGIQPMFGVLAAVVFIAGLGAYLASRSADRSSVAGQHSRAKPPVPLV